MRSIPGSTVSFKIIVVGALEHVDVNLWGEVGWNLQILMFKYYVHVLPFSRKCFLILIQL